jgi:translocator protein
MASKKVDTFVQLTASFVGIMFAYVILILSSLPYYNWFINLKKPFIAINISYFSFIWLIIYLLMVVTFILIWRNGFENEKVKNTMYLLIALTILPIIYSTLYFQFQSIVAGLIFVIISGILVILSIKKSVIISKTAGILLIPYAVWAMYLIILNIWILIMNY